jgi:hypothetical protein
MLSTKKSRMSVCRESCRSPAGANPARPIGRSAGSNQGDEGGNEFVEVLCVKVTSGDRANMQAGTRVNAEQASKRTVAEADPSDIWGRPMPLDETATASNGSIERTCRPERE